MKRPVVRALVIVAIALSIRGIYVASAAPTACLAINGDPISDMDTFHRWALTIASGDWLGRSDFHPFHPWQAAVAPPGQWNAWYGHVYHQEPFYPYAIAVLYTILPAGLWTVVAAQMLLGAAGCAFAYLAARRVAPEGAAMTAGLLSAAYGPYLYYESLLLRDSFLIPVHAALLWAALEARSRTGGARAWWAATGVLAAISFLTKASILPFVVLFAALVLLERRAAPGSRRFGGPAAMAAAFALTLVPCVARNVAVGAPPLKTTTRGPIEFINGNNPWHIGTGWFDGDDRRISEYARRVMSAADGRLLPTIRAVLGDWSGNPSGFLALQMRKLGFALAPFEMPNNASYSYFRIRCPVLVLLPSFFWVFPFAVAGAVVSMARWRDCLPVWLFLGCGIATTVAFYVIARFRAPLMPAFMIFAGWGLHALVTAARDRRVLRAAALAALPAAVFVVEARHDYPDRDLVRPQDFLIAMEDFRHRGLPRSALREAVDGRALFPSLPEFARESGLLHLELGHRDEAREALRAALALDPSDPIARRALSSMSNGSSP